MATLEAFRGAEIGGVLRGRPEPRHEIGLGRQFGEVVAEIGDEVAPLAPPQVPERALDLADVLVGGHLLAAVAGFVKMIATGFGERNRRPSPSVPEKAVAHGKVDEPYAFESEPRLPPEPAHPHALQEEVLGVRPGCRSNGDGIVATALCS